MTILVVGAGATGGLLRYSTRAGRTRRDEDAYAVAGGATLRSLTG
jgi:hypothetical protein